MCISQVILPRHLGSNYYHLSVYFCCSRVSFLNLDSKYHDSRYFCSSLFHVPVCNCIFKNFNFLKFVFSYFWVENSIFFIADAPWTLCLWQMHRQIFFCAGESFSEAKDESVSLCLPWIMIQETVLLQKSIHNVNGQRQLITVGWSI